MGRKGTERMKNPKSMTFAEMTLAVEQMREELKRRNPLGVNMYVPYLYKARLALDEISRAEKNNRTCECGPKEK